MFPVFHSSIFIMVLLRKRVKLSYERATRMSQVFCSKAVQFSSFFLRPLKHPKSMENDFYKQIVTFLSFQTFFKSIATQILLDVRCDLLEKVFRHINFSKYRRTISKLQRSSSYTTEKKALSFQWAMRSRGSPADDDNTAKVFHFFCLSLVFILTRGLMSFRGPLGLRGIYDDVSSAGAIERCWTTKYGTMKIKTIYTN